MRCAHFDCFNGIAGDMLLAALIDAGFPIESLQQLVNQLGLENVEVAAERVRRHGMAAAQVHVRVNTENPKRHRHLPDITQMIDAAGLSPRVTERAKRIFQRLAEAEAAAHGIEIKKVHFHEVGADDAIVDIVGACLGLEHFGIDSVSCSPIPVGSGTVTCDHGVMPVPAPATANLLAGAPIAASEEPGELTTPTGAAIATALAERFGPIPTMTVRAIGVGTGQREGQTRPNLFRLFVGEPNAATDASAGTVTVLETQLDDVPGQTIGYLTQLLLDAGALDAYIVPIIMKKGRPGQLVTVICEPAHAATLEDALFRHTGTLGVRRQEVARTRLTREHVTVETPFGPVRVKLGRRGGELLRAWPEYEDCAAAAAKHGATLHAVQQAALQVWSQGRHDSGGDG